MSAHTRPHTRPAFACVAATLALVTAALAAAPASATGAYRWPVDGRVLRGFEVGETPYAAGHRGIDLAAPPGTEVGASATGVVAFTGVVVGTRWVSLEHPDGVRTTVGPLATSVVRRGQRVRSGTVVGVAAGRHDGRAALHWSARRDGRYLDPASLLGQPAWRPTLVGPGTWAVTDEPDVPSYGDWAGDHRLELFVPGSPIADGPGWALPPNPNHVIVIAGFGSASGEPPLDVRDLGYAPESITELSHAGRDPRARGAPDDPRRDQLPYAAADTFVGVDTLARGLRDQLRAHARARPGRAVDLVAHSMGGVVAMHYLLTMHDPTDPTLPPIAHVATFASPLEGADTANLADGVSEAILGQALLELAGTAEAAASRTTDDLAVGSPLLRALAEAWARARSDRYAGPLATGTKILTVGASRDVVVSEHRSDLPGAEHVVIPGGHSSALDTEAARLVLREFLADEPPPGESGGLGHLLSYPVGGLERLLGVLGSGLDDVLGAGIPDPLRDPTLETATAIARRVPWPVG